MENRTLFKRPDCTGSDYSTVIFVVN
ncbi:unnamed protein product, partial [Rotaria magnacalcarata]